jgi:hypothetical protein
MVQGEYPKSELLIPPFSAPEGLESNFLLLGTEIDVAHFDTMQHSDTSVTPQVFKFIRPSNDGRRY